MTCSVLKEDYENNELVYSGFSPPIKARTGKIVNSYEMYFSEDYYVMEFEIEPSYSDIKDLKQKVKSGNYHKDPREKEKRLSREEILERFRCLNTPDMPDEMEISRYIGKRAMEHIEQIRSCLEEIIDVEFVLKKYAHGWVYRVVSKSKLIFLLTFQRNGFKVSITSLKMKTKKDMAKYNELSDEGKKRWEKGDNGKLIVYRVENEKHLKDIMLFIGMKVNKEIIKIGGE
jgi:hypothetical protein